ncbi:HNH endonuclease, partial [bacterium]
NIKLRPVEYDRACYDSIIIDNNDSFITTTPSQERIKLAKSFFITELKLLSTEQIFKILNKIENTDLTVIELEGKKDSALMFELENNRGRDLTNMEKIKSYFMYQMYVYSDPDQTESNIENVSNIFKAIYSLINDLNLNEDSILIYHNNAYIKGYNYRTLDDLKEVFKASKTKIEWIKTYVNDLHTSFQNIKKFENSKNEYALKLCELGVPAFIYPFIIKGYRYFGDNPDKLESLFKLLEIITFRSRLINSRANIQERLNNILLSFEGDINSLIVDIKLKLNESWYWSDTNVSNYLDGGMYGNNVINYLLWQYENSIQNKGYSIKNSKLTNEQIEHISPKKPTNGDPITSGYEINSKKEYTDEFIAKHLNCLGNLMLISGSHNSSIGNKPFRKKLDSYAKNPLLNQQAEIKDFVEPKGNSFKWDSISISKRHSKILLFSINRWSLNALSEIKIVNEVKK